MTLLYDVFAAHAIQGGWRLARVLFHRLVEEGNGPIRTFA